ncbi:MAG: 1-deoxy-D-xylulose-5-phosphate reductoisomerase [Bacteroidia bacterium]|nr:1-deoxy-D-xylulose-5-phosphate reductoisomerase [Bacteroidia bacterium]
MKKKIAIFGSTGSVGIQALEVIASHSDIFEVEALTANNNSELLIKQALKFNPNTVVIANESKYKEVKEALSKRDIKVFAGKESLARIAGMSGIDMVLAAMVGYAGLLPAIKAIEAGKDIALANKETLVVAGELINKIVSENQVVILPVDSEHSAIFQCLVGEYHNPVEKIYLTASGGPFREMSIEELFYVSSKDALKHPVWNMGAKVTIDSATLMNKGLEAIEARWLFNMKPEQIQVIIHPQSIIHSMVQFQDGSIKAQMSLPDMKLPIQYALGFPNRLTSDFPRFDFMNYKSFTFEQPDMKKFPNLALAFEALRKGGNMPCVLNAANEIAVEAFLKDRIGFFDIPDVIEKTMHTISNIQNPSYQDYVESDNEARKLALSLIKNKVN